MTIEEQELALAKEYLAYWKPQLRLDHMDFELSMLPPSCSNGNIARTTVAPEQHQQKIQIRHPSERSERDYTIFRLDLEVAIVHELLHTKEYPWRDHPKVDGVFKEDPWLVQLHEDSLDAVAEALVRVRRGLTG